MASTYTVNGTVSSDGQAKTTAGTPGESTFTITVGGAHTATLPNEQYVLSALTDPWVTSQRTATLDQLTQLGFGTPPSGQVDLTSWPRPPSPTGRPPP